MYKKMTCWTLVFMLLMSIFGFTYADIAADLNTITLMHTNDTHSRVLEGQYDGMGFAKLATEIKNVRQKNPNSLLLDAGDTLHGQTFATLTKGESIVTLMNLMGYDAMTPGNHDFNYGTDRLIELSKEMNFPLLSANIKRDDDSVVFKPYMIKEVGAVKVGIFGVTTPETAYKTHPDNVKGIKFADPVEEARNIVKELEGQVDIIICLSHLGVEGAETTSKMLAEAVPQINLIVDGHSHTVLNDGLKVGETVIVQTGEYDKNLGIVDIEMAEGKIVSIKPSLYSKEKAANIIEDQVVSAKIKEIDEANKTITDVVVGKTETILDGERASVRKGETNLGDLITDAMLDATGADVAITNGGGIRASIDAGDITKGEIITVLPFGNYVVTKNVTGQDIWDALEHGVKLYPEENGAFPHVSGVKYTFDPNKPVGSRIVSVTVKDVPIDLNKPYKLATNDFMAAGGDDYQMFADNKITGEFDALDNVVETLVRSKKVINVLVDDRITALKMNTEPLIETPAVEPVVVPTPEPIPVVTPIQEPMPAVEPVQRAVQYTVQPNDVLWRIAEKYHIDWHMISEYNQLKNPNFIYPGQVLIIPAQ